jgi:hypothetical protein
MGVEKPTGDGLVQAGAGAATGLISMIGQKKRSERAHNRNLEYMDVQRQNQEALNRQGHRLQMDMWNKTNYGAQMGHMKEAGLNPGLMYGQSGTGGSTGSQGGGSASGSSAPAIQGMDMQNMLMGAQAAKLIAETKNIDKDTNKKGGEIEVLEAQVGEIKANEKLRVAQEGETNARAWETRTKAQLNELDVEKYKINGLSPQDTIIVKTLTEGGITLANAWKWLWNSTLEQKMEYVFPMGPVWEKWAKEWEDDGIEFKKDKEGKIIYR